MTKEEIIDEYVPFTVNKVAMKDYADFETAKLLKELGYREGVLNYYTEQNPAMKKEDYTVALRACNGYTDMNHQSNAWCYSAPHLYDAQAFIEERGIYLNVCYYRGHDFDKDKNGFFVAIVHDDGVVLEKVDGYKYRQEALQAGIKGALKLLNGK
jgi:hypothetical protein